MDSDGDGMTNGQELGDPDCTWTRGTVLSRSSSITHPGVCDPWSDDRCLETNTWVNCDVESFKCDALQADPDTRNVTYRFPSTPVPNTETNYMCMTFDLPGDETYHLVATEPYIDNAQVMHHILVYGCEGENPPSLNEPTTCGMEAGVGCNILIGLWQVGFSGHCIHPNTGFVFGKGAFTRIKIEFHWNNPELRDDYTDSSGMRFFYTPNLRPYAAATMMVGQMYLEIPPQQPSVQITGSCSPRCTRSIIKEPIYVIEAFNHMHYLGKSQKVELFRNNSLVATLSNDEVFSYDAPVGHSHDPPIPLLPGDEIRTTCEFDSQYKDITTYYGEGTSDEMCFTFLTVYPREALPITRNCIGYKDRSYCRGPQQDNGDDQGCDFSKFLNNSIPEWRTFTSDVSTHCQPFEPCTEECLEVMAPMADHPCFKGRAFEIAKQYMMNDKTALYFLAQLMSCKPRLSCPQCPRCRDATTTTTTTTATAANSNNNEYSRRAGKAAALVPGLLSMATLLLLAFLSK